jgi:TonB family protein
MAFRALLFSKNSGTNAAMSAACATAEIRAEICTDIFTAIEKGKTRAYSCVIVDWADQPEANFLLKRARESTPNHETIAVAVVDHDPTKAELRDNRLDFLVHRPIGAKEASAVLAQACEKMQPMSAEDAREAFEKEQSRRADEPEVSGRTHTHSHTPSDVRQEVEVDLPPAFSEADPDEFISDVAVDQEQPRGHALSFRSVCAALLGLAAAFLLWNSRQVVQYMSRAPEGGFAVLRDSVAALFYANKTGALPVGSVGSDAQQDAYFSRDANSSAHNINLAVAATENTLAETRIPLPKAPDFPLPTPTVERQEVAPVHVERAAIPDSMRNSAPIERPVVVTVSPTQMMPVSTPQLQPAIEQQVNEPVSVSEEAARALLIHSVNPVYPQEAMAQKLHGPVVLQALVGRDGSVQDLKIVRGNFVLVRAAIAAVKQWRFQPYTLNGHAASTQTVITINFNYPPG